MRYIRNPGGASNAEEARERIRLWMQARRRAVSQNLPDLGAIEQVKALENMVKEVERKHVDFARW